MHHYTILHRIERTLILMICAVLILGVGLNPAHAEKITRPVQQIYCDFYSNTGMGWYTRILTQVLYPPSGNWDIYSTDPCSPYNDRVRLTTSSAFDGYARFNLDATRIVFVSERDGNPEIYIMNADGSEQTRLTSNPAVDTAPAFSPDGTKIAYVSERDGNPEIYVMNADGSGQTRLTTNDLQDYDPSWSPDGKLITWVEGSDSARQVFLMNADGNAQSPLSAPLKNARRPVWSPKGDRLALEADDNGDGWQDLIEISSDGTGSLVLPISKVVTAGYGEDFLMGGWCSDGSNLVFTRAAYYVNNGARTLKSAMLQETTLTGEISNVDSSADPSFYPSVASSDPYPPVTSLQPLPTYTRSGSTTLNWTATDTGASGLSSYTIETAILPDGDWTPGDFYCPQKVQTDPFFWSGACSPTSYSGGKAGDTVAYRITATDKAGNQVALPAQVSTTLFDYKMEGRVTDARDYPLPNAQIQVGENLISRIDAQNKATLYFKGAGPAQASFNAPGYGSFPPQTWPLQRDDHFLAALPPAQNLMVNGDFEAPDSTLAGWQTGGSLPVQPGLGISGNRAAQLGEQCDNNLCLTPLEPVVEKYIYSSSMVVGSDGTTHVLVDHSGISNGGIRTYFTRPRDGTWSMGQDLPHVTNPSRLMISGDDTLYFTYVNDINLSDNLAYKPRGGDWTFETIPYLNTSTYGYAFTVDAQNGFHLIYQHTQGGIRYIRRQTDGSWAGPFLLPLDLHNNNLLGFLVSAGQDGTLHLVYQETAPGYSSYPLRPWYTQLAADGSLTAAEQLPTFYPQIGWWDEYGLDSLLVSANGDVHVLATDLYDSKAVYWKRSANGTWSDPNVIGGEWEEEYDMVAGPGGDAAIFAEQYYGSGVLYYYRPAGETQFTHGAADLGRRYRRLTPALDERGQLQILLEDFTGGSGDLYYGRLVPPALSGQANIQQTVAIPVDLPNPTLSFRYKVDQEFPGPASEMEVSIIPSGGDPTSAFTSSAERGSWLHGWIDLSGYAGQTVTIAFHLNQAAGEWYARLLLDEVSLGAWTTPVIQSLSPDVIPLSDASQTTLRLSGLNLDGGAQVFVGDHPVERVILDPSSGDLLITLPADLPSGVYPIRVVYSDGREAIAPRSLRLGYLSYLPILSR